jgi:L-Ala-D/L-Glu epimerase
MTPTTIVAVSIEPFDVALTESFGIAGGAHAIAKNVLFRVRLANGSEGIGEAAPLPAFNGETQALAETALRTLEPLLVGKDLRAWRPLVEATREAVSVASARCAAETALLDGLLRHQQLSMHTYFGGAETSLRSDVTLPTGSVERIREVMPQWQKLGFSTIKIKVGGSSVDDDLARLRVLAEVAPEVAIIADANAGLTEDEARRFVRELRQANLSLALFEQPVAKDDLDGLCAVSREGVRVAADESAWSLASVATLLQKKAVDVVNIKLMKTGLEEARAIVALVRAHGGSLMIGGMVESSLAIATSAAFAGGLGGFAFVDLDTPLFFTESRFEGGYTLEGPTLRLDPEAFGHGVRPRVGRVAPPA